MKFKKKIILINSCIISALTALIVVAAALAGTRAVSGNIRNSLIDTVSSRAAVISSAQGIVPDDFDYNVNGVYLSVYRSDGTLKNGSFPGPVDLPIRKGVVSTVTVGGERYYVYDFAVSLDGRDDIYLRGMVSSSNSVWMIAAVSFAVFAGVLAAAGILLNIFSVRKAVKPIDRMRKEVQEITETKDIRRRLSEISSDSDLACLADDYNIMLDSLEGLFRNHERFASDVAHELRTPLTVILSESEYAIEDTQDVAEKNESLKVIYRQSKRLKAITDSLLEFTRVANRLSVRLSPLDASSLTAEFLEDYAFPQGVTCHTDIEEGIAVSAEVTLYERILQNLVDNAVKYGKPGGNVYVSLKKAEQKAVLAVRDDGVGMSREAVAHAFDRFYRAETTRNDRSGLGLGLSFVKEIVRLFGASVSIQSERGEGTCVTVTFDLLETLPDAP